MRNNNNTQTPYGHIILAVMSLIMLIMLGVLVHDTRYIMHEDAQLVEMGEEMEGLQQAYATCEHDTETYGGVCSVEHTDYGFEVIWSAE